MQPVIQLLLDQPDLTVITATRRLSRRLLHEYNQHQLASGLTAWPTPDILSWSAWVQRQWQQASIQSVSQQVVLSSAQSLHVWQAIIEADSDALINAQSTARQAQTARQQIIDYTLDLKDEASRQWFVYDADASRWLDWYHQYTQQLADKNWLDSPALTQSLIQQITGNQQDIEYSLCFIGFDSLTPLQQQLQAWLESRDLWFTPPTEDRSPGNAELLAAEDPAQEIEHAADWARDRFENHWQTGDEPIGVIVPKLERSREQIERTFREVFYPQDGLPELVNESLHTQGIREDSIFNISLGYSLKQEPIIATALKILSLCRRSFSYEDFSQVLRSPFIADAAEQRSSRSALDNYLRRKASAEISLNGLIAGFPTDETNEFQELLSELSTLKQSWRHKASAQTWVNCFQQCLSLFGVLKSDDQYQTAYQHQVMQSLDEVWFEFSRIALVKDLMSLEQAITTFTQMVNSQIFQSGAAELPVQILGVIEAAGMRFSSVWVMGMTEQNWPPPANPNPFIPLRLQRQHGMPHCSPQREFEYASQQTERMLQAADNIVFSYSRQDGEEELVASPLVADFEIKEVSAKVLQPIEITELVSLIDEQGPAIDIDNYQTGSNALKDQSHCPFRAFVVHRLKSRLPEEPQPGNDPRLRGNLVHRIMELLWKDWKTSDQLHALSSEALETVVTETIEQVMQSEWIGGNREYEAKRLFNLVIEWLEQEKQRQPFSVKSLEQETIASINQLKLKLYIDRIDELADGSSCVVDYKTGVASANDWLSERPNEPQLPLYALIQPGEVNAVTFANIRAGESRYVGVTKDQALIGIDEKALKDIKQIPVTKGSSLLKHYESWEAMRDEWQQTIHALADNHVQGDARVDPKEYPKTCNYCDVNSICRLFDWQEEEGEV
jgi:probable DNA repair protein